VERFFDLAFGTDSERHQRRRGSYDRYAAARALPAPAGLGEAEIEFLSRRDSFYLATVGANGWPYVQHRGGPAGFVKVVDPTRLAWAERSGNRQYVTAGHVDHDDRVAIIAVDYPNRQRLKLLGHAHFDPDPAPELLARLDVEGRLDGLVTVEVAAFDWNCPKFITPRFTADEVRAVIEPLQHRIRELEAALAQADHNTDIDRNMGTHPRMAPLGDDPRRADAVTCVR
jgi:predicted pyridoxine 5'-phosphate oxidase superfamily flavin-nucleotide-binding protein